MASITQVLMSLFSPQIFWSIVGALSLIFVIVLIISIFSDKKSKAADESLGKRIGELEGELSGKDSELSSLKDKFNAKEADGRKQLIRLEEQINENEASKTKIKDLGATLKEKEDAFTKSRVTLEELDKRLKAIQPEIDKGKKDLALKQEMYDGLKTQYDELEAQVADKTKKLQDEFDKNKKLQDEIKQLQLKLEEAFKKHSEAAKEKEKVVLPAAPIIAIEQPKKDEHKVLPQEEIKQAQIKKEGPNLAAVKEEKSLETPSSPPAASAAVPASNKPVSEKPKSQVQFSQVDKQKAASESVEKSKLPPKSEAKVRLAQVMQEAAKVAAKMEEGKKSDDGKSNPAGKKEDSQNPEKDKPPA